MEKAILGTKIGMTQIFGEGGVVDSRNCCYGRPMRSYTEEDC